MNDGVKGMWATLVQRFGEEVTAIPAGQGPWPQSCPQTWRRLAARGPCRRFAERPVAPELIETLCALALCAPTKSDLKQRDIVIERVPGVGARDRCGTANRANLRAGLTDTCRRVACTRSH